MKESTKILRKVLFTAILCLIILFFSQPKVNARTLKTISTMEELKEAFDGKATVEGNTIKLTDNVTLSENLLDITISELVIDFNGKTIECTDDGALYICNKATFQDSSTTDESEWGEVIFNSKYTSIQVKESAELIINSGKFVDTTDTYAMIEVFGKLTINYAIFSTTRTEPNTSYQNSMIVFRENSEGIINDGSFTHCDTIIDVQASNPYKNNCKLTINGGSFVSTWELPAISIISLYPYVDENNNNEVITPTVVLNNCTAEGKVIALEFLGGSTEEDFKDTDTKILTILGGTYKTSEEGITAFEISTFLSPFTYFNPKDFDLQNGTFECEGVGGGAIRLDGPRKR